MKQIIILYAEDNARSFYSIFIFWGGVQIWLVIELKLVTDRQVDEILHHDAGDALAGAVGGGAAQPGPLSVLLPDLEQTLGLVELVLEAVVEAVHGVHAPTPAHLAHLRHLHKVD